MIHRFLGAVAVVSLGFCYSPGADASQTMDYKLWGSPDGRQDYQVMLFELAMQKTAGEYPAYTLIQNNQSMGSVRGRREVTKGTLVNFYASPVRPEGDLQASALIAIPIPLLKGLLGYRKLSIRKNDAARFARINNEKELKLLRQARAEGGRM